MLVVPANESGKPEAVDILPTHYVLRLKFYLGWNLRLRLQCFFLWDDRLGFDYRLAEYGLEIVKRLALLVRSHDAILSNMDELAFFPKLQQLGPEQCVRATGSGSRDAYPVLYFLVEVEVLVEDGLLDGRLYNLLFFFIVVVGVLHNFVIGLTANKLLVAGAVVDHIDSAIEYLIARQDGQHAHQLDHPFVGGAAEYQLPSVRILHLCLNDLFELVLHRLATDDTLLFPVAVAVGY